MFRHFKTDTLPPKESLSAIGIILKLPVPELQNLLRHAGLFLSMALPNDAIVLWYLEKNPNAQRTRLLLEINDTLYDFGFPLLLTREKEE